MLHVGEDGRYHVEASDPAAQQQIIETIEASETSIESEAVIIDENDASVITTEVQQVPVSILAKPGQEGEQIQQVCLTHFIIHILAVSK